MQWANELTGRCILVTGATSGIGSEIASGLSEVHTKLIITGRDRQRLNDLSAAFSESNPHFHAALQADLSESADIKMLAEQTDALDGRP